MVLLTFLIFSSYIYDYTFVTTGKTSFAEVDTSVRIPGCGDLICSDGEFCPIDNISCNDIKCYEPTCESGCGLGFVLNGMTDEACFGTTGCSGTSCTCDGIGNCISSATQEPVITSGGGGGVPATTSVNITDFNISISTLFITLYEGDTFNTSVKVTNTGNTPIEFSVDSTSLINLIFLSDYSFELQEKESKTLSVIAVASKQFPPDIYTGHIIFTAGGISKSVITIVEIKQKQALFDIKLISESKKVYQGDTAPFDVTIKNMGNLMPVDVYLEFVLKDMFNNLIIKKTETIAINEEIDIKRNMEIPDTLTPAHYVIYAKLIYENNTATSSDIITVMEKIKQRPEEIFHYEKYWIYIIIILIGILLTILSILFISKKYFFVLRKISKKKQHK
jgi:hypothetical protein